jgi:hypothetical protein
VFVILKEFLQSLSGKDEFTVDFSPLVLLYNALLAFSFLSSFFFLRKKTFLVQKDEEGSHKKESISQSLSSILVTFQYAFKKKNKRFVPSRDSTPHPSSDPTSPEYCSGGKLGQS